MTKDKYDALCTLYGLDEWSANTFWERKPDDAVDWSDDLWRAALHAFTVGVRQIRSEPLSRCGKFKLWFKRCLS